MSRKENKDVDRGREAQWLLKGWLIEIDANWPSNHHAGPAQPQPNQNNSIKWENVCEQGKMKSIQLLLETKVCF